MISPRSIVRAARLTYRQQLMAPAGITDIVASFRKYLRQPTRVIDYCRRLAETGNWKELDRVAQETELLFLEGGRPIYLHDLDQLERRIAFECGSLVAQSMESVAQLSRAVKYIIESDIPGDLVECGVYQGGSIVCIIRTLQALKSVDRKVWLYDTFEGFPEPQEIDRHYKQTATEDGGLKSWALHKRDDGSKGSNWCYCPIDQVKASIFRTGYPEDKLIFVKGMVEDTIPQNAPERISLLRLDTDFYKSTKHELDHLYPRLSKGGVLIIDDYGAYRGSRAAVDEYIAENKLKVLLS